MKYHLLTYGCQMNKNDSERIAGLLSDLSPYGRSPAGRGFEPTDDYREADLIILNTCSVRQSAEDRVYGMMKNFAKLKKDNPNLIVVVTGCMAGRDKDGKIRARMPAVDIFLPTERIVELPKILASRFSPPFEGGARGGKSSGYLPAPLLSKEGTISSYLDIVPKHSSKSQAFVTIQTGCEEYCTYCVVPYARGKIKNRPLKDILDEVKNAVAGGAIEITLLGQIVNAWEAEDTNNFFEDNPYKIHPGPPFQKEGASPFRKGGQRGIFFAALLWEINQIPGVKRLNFFSAHPRYMTDEVISAMTLPAHLDYLHLPVQSGSDKILQKMNRRYTVAEYLEVIKKVRAATLSVAMGTLSVPAKPDVALATDIIVGFPGETVEDFLETVELYKKCDFDIAYLAKYSPRSGTPAFRALKDDVNREEKERRWQVLQKLMEETALKKNQKYLGQTVEVLVEDCKNNKCWGWSRENKRVVFAGDKSLIGQIINVMVEKAKEWELEGGEVCR